MINFNFLFNFFFAEVGYLLKALFVRESQVLEVYIFSLFSNSKLILMHLRRTMTTNCSVSHCSPRASMLDLHWNSSIKEENLVQ